MHAELSDEQMAALSWEEKADAYCYDCGEPTLFSAVAPEGGWDGMSDEQVAQHLEQLGDPHARCFM